MRSILCLFRSVFNGTEEKRCVKDSCRLPVCCDTCGKRSVAENASCLCPASLAADRFCRDAFSECFSDKPFIAFEEMIIFFPLLMSYQPH